MVTLAISDVPGDDPAVIGSGPTVPDPTTLADARAIVARYRLDLPDVVTRSLADPNNESPKPNDPIFAKSEFRLIARPADAFRAAEREARKLGYEPVMLGDRIEGEARDVAAEHAACALALQQQGRRVVILSGGASANWIAPVEELTLADKQAVTRALLRTGANIGEINTVR